MSSKFTYAVTNGGSMAAAYKAMFPRPPSVFEPLETVPFHRDVMKCVGIEHWRGFQEWVHLAASDIHVKNGVTNMTWRAMSVDMLAFMNARNSTKP